MSSGLASPICLFPSNRRVSYLHKLPAGRRRSVPDRRLLNTKSTGLLPNSLRLIPESSRFRTISRRQDAIRRGLEAISRRITYPIRREDFTRDVASMRHLGKKAPSGDEAFCN